MIAMALANEPDLLIADEPTTALDVTVQAQILELLRELQQPRPAWRCCSSPTISASCASIADRVCVMRMARSSRAGRPSEVFANPQHPYTRQLIAAEPKGAAATPRSRARRWSSRPSDIKVWFPIKRGLFRRTVGHVKAVDGIDVEVRAGQTLGVVGESGSGKTTLGLALLRLISSRGPIVFLGQRYPGPCAATCGRCARRCRSSSRIPWLARPRMSIRQIVEEGLMVHEPAARAPRNATRAWSPGA